MPTFSYLIVFGKKLQEKKGMGANMLWVTSRQVLRFQ